MRKENIIEVTKEVTIGNGIILEKGDRIQIVNESREVEFDLNYVDGTLDLDAKTLTVYFSADEDDKEARLLAAHKNDPVLEEIYDYLSNDGYDDWVVDDNKKGTVDYDGDGNTVTLFLK